LTLLLDSRVLCFLRAQESFGLLKTIEKEGLPEGAGAKSRGGRPRHIYAPGIQQEPTLKKLFAPTLEKALTFLDDKLLPSTSNAVERSNRRYRKMQKSVYRVRTQAQIRARLALDMWREAQAEGRQQTLAALHRARAG
jgi:DNA-binding PadR family transcriptional regulator